MEYSTGELLKNASFSAKHYNRFDHYMTLLNLAKGVVSSGIDVASIKELEKLNFKIDPLTDYITNVFDYDMYIKDGSPDVIHVVDAIQKRQVGTLTVDMSGERLRLAVDSTNGNITETLDIVIE